MAEEKSGFMKFVSAIWQFPIFSIIFLIIVAFSSVKMYDDSAFIQDQVNTGLDTDLSIKSGLLWTLVGIFAVDGGITFLSIVTSKWVHDCCWDSQMQKCPCCTQFVCYILNWFLFGMSYLLGILCIVLTGVGSVLIVFGVSVEGLCTADGTSDADIMAWINKILKALHDWVCDNSNGVDCDAFPSAITEDMVPDLCTSMTNISDRGGKFFGYVGMVIVAQWSFAIIQRANLVEGAVRRDMAKENNKDGDADANEATGNNGPNV